MARWIIALLFLLGAGGNPCPPGAVLVGAAPPRGLEQWCEVRNEKGEAIKHGLWTIWYAEGKKKSESLMNKGAAGRQERWFENGQMSDRLEIRGEGKTSFKTWYENGQPKTEGAWEGKQADGRWTHWFEDGKIESEGEYYRGMKIGIWTFRHANGEKKEEGDYISGEPNGRWVYWYDTGKKKAEGPYRRGKRVGLWTWWRPNGDKEKEQDFGESESVK